MKAFISYSVNEQEQYIVTLLSYKLRELGFTLITNSNFSDTIDYTIRNNIFQAQLFVGLVSSTGAQWQRVLEEYKLAVANKTPSMLLVEDNVPVATSFKGNFVRFNRNNPHTAIDEIQRRMTIQQPANNEALGWVIGGAAFLAIIALLTNGNKK